MYNPEETWSDVMFGVILSNISLTSSILSVLIYPNFYSPYWLQRLLIQQQCFTSNLAYLTLLNLTSQIKIKPFPT